jgi:hypothetical protein
MAKEEKPKAKLAVMESIPVMTADDIHVAVKARMEELQPAVNEFHELQQAEHALNQALGKLQ